MSVSAAPSEEEVRFHRVQVLGHRGAWRPLVGSLVLLAGMFLAVGLLALIPFLVYYAAQGTDAATAVRHVTDLDHPTPVSLAYLNVALALLIPGAMVVNLAFQGLRPRWLASVGPRLRWHFLVVCVGLAVVALVATLVVSAALPDQGGQAVSGHAHPWTSTTRDFVLVLLFLTPLQAAGEEYVFRGYLLQAFGGLSARLGDRGSAVVAVLVSGLLFGLAHGIGQSLPVFFDRFAFGVVAGTLAVLTGGLEAGIAMHVLNNWLAFGLALAYGDMGTALNATGGSSWWQIPTTLTQSLVYLALAVLVARRMRLRTVVERGVLERSRARV